MKYQAVADYLSGAGSLRTICKKYKIGNKKRLQDWIKLYNSHKELKCYTGGSRMTKGRDTTYEERIAFVKECIENGYNYIEISEKYKVGYKEHPDKGHRRIRDDLEKDYDIRTSNKRVPNLCRVLHIQSTVKFRKQGCTRNASDP